MATDLTATNRETVDLSIILPPISPCRRHRLIKLEFHGTDTDTDTDTDIRDAPIV